MLIELAIRHFAIIDDLRIRFDDGLTVLSGETGAGKSIILNAVNLLLGARVSAQLIRSGEETAELEALFELDRGSAAMALLREQGFASDEGLLIRRIIARNGRHKTYVNGRLTPTRLLQQISDNLASISGQHAYQGLLKEENHLLLLDQVGGLMPLRQEVNVLYEAMLPLIEKYQRLVRLQDRQAEQVQLLTFQQKEIAAADFSPDEDETLAREQKRLKHAEQLYTVVETVTRQLYDGQTAATTMIGASKAQMEKAAGIDESLLPHVQQLEQMVFGIEDLTLALRSYQSQIDTDQNRLAAVEERIHVLDRLKRKYGGSLSAVTKRFAEIAAELQQISDLSRNIDQAETEMMAAAQKLGETAERLSQKRQAAADKMAGQVESELAALKMAGTRFKVGLSSLKAENNTPAGLNYKGRRVDEYGLDRAAFLLSANVGEELKPLAAVASGGELSRVVLALKIILAGKDAVETVIFDEVDAGIGGATAEVVGRKIAQLAQFHQVLCITHLPQLARFADHHFRIVKEVVKGRTCTHMTPLDMTQRADELARMLGGEEVTPASLAHARELLGEINKHKKEPPHA